MEILIAAVAVILYALYQLFSRKPQIEEGTRSGAGSSDHFGGMFLTLIIVAVAFFILFSMGSISTYDSGPMQEAWDITNAEENATGQCFINCD